MASIRKRTSKEGDTAYHVQVRLKGHVFLLKNLTFYRDAPQPRTQHLWRHHLGSFLTEFFILSFSTIHTFFHSASLQRFAFDGRKP